MSATASRAFAGLLAAAGVDQTSVIRVTGGGGLPALLWLCRHGYDDVGYLKFGRAAPHEEVDALLVGHACDLAELSALLAHGPPLRAGGVLIFRSPLPPTLGRDPVHALLEAFGYRVERCVRGRTRELHIARRCRRLDTAA